MNFSYITILSDDSYIRGVEGLFYTLTKHCKYPLLVLVSQSISHSTILRLEKKSIPFKIVQNLHLDCNFEDSSFNYWKNTFFKFRVFELTEFDKIVYLDSDMLILDNIDELFECPHLSAVSDRDFCVYMETNGMNTGMMVIKPDKKYITDLLNTYQMKYMSGGGRDAFGDQNIINDTFTDWETNTALHLPITYNVNYRMMHLYDKKISVKVVHFALQPKPWNESAVRLFFKMCGHLLRRRMKNVKSLVTALKAYK